MTATTPIFGLLCGSYVNAAFSDPAEFALSGVSAVCHQFILATANSSASNELFTILKNNDPANRYCAL